MENVLLIVTVSFGVLAVIILILYTLLKTKLMETEEALEKTQSTLDKQTKVVKQSNASSAKVSEIQQKAKQKEKDLVDAVKGAQTSAEPIKKSIDLGNDIVGKFNSK